MSRLNAAGADFAVVVYFGVAISAYSIATPGSMAAPRADHDRPRHPANRSSSSRGTCGRQAQPASSQPYRDQGGPGAPRLRRRRHGAEQKVWGAATADAALTKRPALDAVGGRRRARPPGTVAKTLPDRRPCHGGRGLGRSAYFRRGQRRLIPRSARASVAGTRVKRNSSCRRRSRRSPLQKRLSPLW